MLPVVEDNGSYAATFRIAMRPTERSNRSERSERSNRSERS
jgi:hypothetical protein